MISVSGIDAFRSRLARIEQAIQPAMSAALAEALELLQERAQAILKADVYDHQDPDDPDVHDPENPDSLYQSFVRAVAAVGAGEVSGTLANVAPQALFLEDGTDDEGTGEHWVAPKDAKALRFVGAGGEAMFSKGHMVHGIHPTRFLQRTLDENRDAVREIFARHVQQAVAGA